jgi:RHS repeat-associated protein
LGRRTSKVINSIASQFLYDGRNIVGELGGGALSSSYLRSLNIDEPYIRQTAGGNNLYHVDALGSTLQLTSSTAGLVSTYSYEPFGRATETGSSANVSQYTGRENDGTGLSYYRARYFNPRLQRFITEDPIGFLGGDANFYVYVHNSPLGARDPLGLWTPEFHKRMTRDAALACGMADADADALSGAVYGVDFLLTWPIPSFSTLNPWSAKHAMPGSNWRGYATGQLNAARSGGGLSALGRGIHALQDAHSHDLVGSGMWDHMNGGHDPDDPGAQENKIHADAAINDTINAIRGYMQSRGKPTKCAEAG